MLLMSQTEFAEKVGCTRQNISKLIKQGKLPVEGTKLIMPDAEKAYHLLKAGLPLANKQIDVFAPGEKPPINSGDESDNKTMQDYLNAKVKKEGALGEIHEMNVKKMRNELLSVDEVSAQVVKVCETIRNAFINMPNKISPLIEGLSAAEIQIKLDDEINEILTDLYNLHYEYSDERENTQ